MLVGKKQNEKDNIFMTEANGDDIAGKITYTNIYRSIPDNRVDTPIPDWKKTHKTEWRWRFLKLFIENNTTKDVVEISYIKNDSNDRMYFNRHGQWVKRFIDPIFDQFVSKEYFAYTS